MGTITLKDGIEIFYKDWGNGQPILFHHGWPLSADDWDAQMIFLLGKATASLPTIGGGTAIALGIRHDLLREPAIVQSMTGGIAMPSKSW